MDRKYKVTNHTTAFEKQIKTNYSCHNIMAEATIPCLIEFNK